MKSQLEKIMNGKENIHVFNDCQIITHIFSSFINYIITT